MYQCYQLHCSTAPNATNCVTKAVLQQHSNPGVKAPRYK